MGEGGGGPHQLFGVFVLGYMQSEYQFNLSCSVNFVSHRRNVSKPGIASCFHLVDSCNFCNGNVYTVLCNQ